MRKTKIIGFLVCLILLFSINYTVFSQEGLTEQSTSSDNYVPMVAKVNYPVGEVFIYDMTNELAEPVVAEPEMQLFANHRIETKAESSIEIVLETGTVIKIAENSIFEINELSKLASETQEGQKSLFNLVSGKVRAIVAKVTGQDSSFQITTPNGVASVRGTDLGVSFDTGTGKADLLVFKGLVAFGAKGTEPVMVQAGKMASLVANSISNVIDIPENVKNDFLGNLDIKSDTPAQEEGTTGDSTTGDDGQGTDGTTTTTQTTEGTEEQKTTAETKAKSALEEWLDKYLNMIGDFGTIVIDGKIWSIFTINTEFTFGNIGLGIYAPIIFDPAQGGLFEPANWYNYNEYQFGFDSWGAAYDTLYSVLTKIKYLRINDHDDPFFFKIGSIDDFIIGNGINMFNYSNMINFPAIRYVGVQLKFETEVFAMDMMTNNVLEPGVIGLRPSIKPFKDDFPLQIGLEIIGDISPLYDSENTNPIIGAAAAGLILPIIPNNNFFSVFAYGDAAINYYLTDSGEFGILNGFGAFGGLRGSYFLGTYRLEYRYLAGDFLPQMFNSLYDVSKTSIYNYFADKITNPSTDLSSISGLYFDMTINLFQKIHGAVSYVHYFEIPASFDGVLGDTLILSLILEKDLIPKVFGDLSVKKVNWNVFAENAWSNFQDNLYVDFLLGYEIDKGISILVEYNIFFTPTETGEYEPSVSYSVNTQLSF